MRLSSTGFTKLFVLNFAGPNDPRPFDRRRQAALAFANWQEESLYEKPATGRPEIV
jgi:hypothetical protein